MMVLKREECFQAIDTIIRKIELLEDMSALKNNSNISLYVNRLQDNIENLDLYLEYTENWMLMYRNNKEIENKAM